MLLADRYTLDEICEELHSRGYHYRSGRPFVAVKSSGKRRANKSSIGRIFHNWFYAGWVVSDKAGIAPKEVRGHWKPIVTTEEFERGLEILAQRNAHRVVRRKHTYLLKGLLYIDLPKEKSLVKLTGSTPNTRRPGGGTAYYCVPSSDVNILCHKIDDQVAVAMRNIQIDSMLIPVIRESYTDEIAMKLGHLKPDEREKLEAALKAVDDEESRTARLFATGKITEKVWDNLWADWQDRRRTLLQSLEALHQKQDHHIANLDAALTIVAKIGVLCKHLERRDQIDLLRQMIERVVVNPEGLIIKLELLAPFAYLHQVHQRVQRDGSSTIEEKTKTDNTVGQGSDYVP